MAAPAGNPINGQEIARLLASPKGFNALYVVNKRKHALMGLFDYIGGQSKALKIDSVDGVISSMKLANYKTRSVISASTVTTTQAVLTVSDASIFLLNYVVMDKNRTLGVISAINTGTNQITVNPITTSGLFTVGTDFVASGLDNWVVQLYNLSATQGSDAPAHIKYLPDVFQDNYLQVSRGSMSLTAAEFNATFIDGVQGAKNYQAAFMQYQIALNNFADGIEARMYNGLPKRNVQLTSGTGNTNGGLDWAIQNRGGIFDVGASFPSTSYILDVLTQLRENTGRPNSEFVFVCGPSAKARIALALQNYKLTAGKNSVLDGSGLAVEGFNTTFGYVSLMDSWYMGDKFWNPQISTVTNSRKMSDEFYIITLDATPDFFGAEAPLVRMCYRDEPGVAGASITTSWVNGLIDNNGMRINNASTSNSLDQVTVNWYTNSGIDIVDAAGLYAFKLTA